MSQPEESHVLPMKTIFVSEITRIKALKLDHETLPRIQRVKRLGDNDQLNEL